jgi:cysteine desulfurase/selenocysteine lyase
VTTRLVDDRFRRFFDWATVGPISRAGTERRNDFLARLDGSEHPAALLRSEAAVLETTRAIVARFLGATEVVFGRSVSGLFSLVAASLAHTKARDTVVVTDTEHPVSRLCWTAVGGVTLIVIPPTDSGLVDLDAVAAAVDERCIAVCAAHVTRVSGVVQPIRALARLAHDAGAVLIVDGAQATGRVPIDVGELNSDFYLGSGQKSLLAGSGITFLCGTALARIRPLTWSNANTRLRGSEVVEATPPRHLEPEWPDPAGLHALRGSVEAFLQVSSEHVHRHITDTTTALREAMADVGLRPRYRASNAGIVSYETPTPADVLAARLRDDGFIVSPVD